MSGAAGARQTNRVKTQASLARALGVSRATVTKYVADGLESERDGSFDVKKGLAWKKIASTKMKAGTARTEVGKTADERYREAKASKAEDELQISRGEMVLRSEVTRKWTDQVLLIKSHLLSFGQVIAPQLVGRSIREIQAEIDRKMHQILNQLASEPPKAMRKAS